MARQSFERTKGVLVSFGPRKKRARDSTSLRSTLKDLFGGKPDCTCGRNTSMFTMGGRILLSTMYRNNRS